MIARFTKPQSVQRQDHEQQSFSILQLFIGSPAVRGGEAEAYGHWLSPHQKLSSPAALSPPSLSGLPEAGAQGGTAAPWPPCLPSKGAGRGGR